MLPLDNRLELSRHVIAVSKRLIPRNSLLCLGDYHVLREVRGGKGAI